MTTAVATPVQPASPSAPAYQVYRFSVDQYQRMIEEGILGPDDRVELLAGYLVEKMPHNPPHDGTVGRVDRRLMRLLPDEWLLRVQSSIVLVGSQPEPDLAVVRGPEETYFERHPEPRDIALLIEVADSSLLEDRRKKGPIYAQARIALYWIVNVKDRSIEVYTQPVAGKSPRYRRRQDYTDGQTIPITLGGHEIAQVPVRDLLPPSSPK
jgi:Uma2 family endonuclease